LHPGASIQRNAGLRQLLLRLRAVWQPYPHDGEVIPGFGKTYSDNLSTMLPVCIHFGKPCWMYGCVWNLYPLLPCMNLDFVWISI
jgi:hypothetical protein